MVSQFFFGTVCTGMDGLISLGPDNLLPIVEIILCKKKFFLVIAAAIVQLLLGIDRSHRCFVITNLG